MALETSDEELEFLRRRCNALNLYVNRHRQWDPTRGTGDLYLMRKKKFGSEHEPSILRYATAEEIWSHIEREHRYARA